MISRLPTYSNTFWKPNLFMEGLLCVSQPLLMGKPLSVRYIRRLGWFEYISRIQVKFDCSMNFHYYPADTQTCFLAVRSFAYTKADMNFSWYKNVVYLNNLDLQNFLVRMDKPTLYEMAMTDDPDEVYQFLGFKVVARRKLSFHLIQTYSSTSFYIIISTLCFLLPSSLVEARIGIAMTTLLTLTAMFGAIRDSSPIVSYTKAIDVWMIGCIFFVFLTLLQFVFCIWVKHALKPHSKCSIKSKEPDDRDDPDTSESSQSTDYSITSKILDVVTHRFELF